MWKKKESGFYQSQHTIKNIIEVPSEIFDRCARAALLHQHSAVGF
ncbi:MAG: hypothetical protein PVJ67_00195 [Candidatus Pacearchaeota archaeon]|jgi:hypothetical protein